MAEILKVKKRKRKEKKNIAKFEKYFTQNFSSTLCK
jgi:hypothetical protein